MPAAPRQIPVDLSAPGLRELLAAADREWPGEEILLIHLIDAAGQPVEPEAWAFINPRIGMVGTTKNIK